MDYGLVHGPGLRSSHVIGTGISKSSLSLISDSRAGLCVSLMIYLSSTGSRIHQMLLTLEST